MILELMLKYTPLYFEEFKLFTYDERFICPIQLLNTAMYLMPVFSPAARIKKNNKSTECIFKLTHLKSYVYAGFNCFIQQTQMHLVTCKKKLYLDRACV